MNYKESIEESKRDRLYDCHIKLEESLYRLYCAFENIELSQEENDQLEMLFADVNYELSQLYEELYFS